MNITRSKPAEGCGASPACPLSAACVPDQAMPCEDVSHLHDEKLALCDALEAIADSLPGQVDRFECLRVGAILAPAIRRSHAIEESRIFPVFETASAAPGRASSVARLKAEHLADECAAADVSEELLRVGHGGEIGNPEALGFMLRALFEAMRRHVAFEREHIMPTIGPLDSLDRAG
ncbi:hemerythrin domain-containing protein [Mesorhizobium sp. J428]|uniref:hemerythrin domain-containing protein n=1 Tax=Mesorhizobium sp. J428 TaxID=2898440 RepID=UPI0021514863|nr:hemerythrin domain-containing protein [Mesorhizobium sp. J428]MCR5858159.1 hemerythrin domain-containing protein [Mesorhizobium sp. J428]